MSQPSYASRWPSGNATSSSGVMAGPRLSITSSTTTAVCRARLDRPRATALRALRAEREDVPPDEGSTLLVPLQANLPRGRHVRPGTWPVEAAAIGVTLQLICANCTSDPAVATCATPPPSSDQPAPVQPHPHRRHSRP